MDQTLKRFIMAFSVILFIGLCERSVSNDTSNSSINSGSNEQIQTNSTSTENTASSSSNTIQPHSFPSDSQLNYEADYLLERYSELKSFHTSVEFRTFCFSPGGPYYEWLCELEDWRAALGRTALAGGLAGDIMQLGLEYRSEDDPYGLAAFLDSCIPVDIETYLR